MAITDIDFSTGTWIQIKTWAERELATARQRNDGELDPAQTAALRGSIQTLKRLLALPATVARTNELSGPAD